MVAKDINPVSKEFYSKEDRKIGYILAKDRTGAEVKYPLMTISLAGITNQFHPRSSYGELTNVAVGVKLKAKAVGTSVYLLDRRKTR